MRWEAQICALVLHLQWKSCCKIKLCWLSLTEHFIWACFPKLCFASDSCELIISETSLTGGAFWASCLYSHEQSEDLGQSTASPFFPGRQAGSRG